jgi:hypothetical protein
MVKRRLEKILADGAARPVIPGRRIHARQIAAMAAVAGFLMFSQEVGHRTSQPASLDSARAPAGFFLGLMRRCHALVMLVPLLISNGAMSTSRRSLTEML